MSLDTAELDPVVVRGFRGDERSTPEHDALATPFAEGAKARAIVDLCDREGLAAYFLGPGGRVIHVNAAAGCRPVAGLTIRWGQLHAADPAQEAALQDAIVRATSPEAIEPVVEAGAVEISDAFGDPSFLLCFAYPNRSPFQMLRAVVAVSRDRVLPARQAETLVGLLRQG